MTEKLLEATEEKKIATLETYKGDTFNIFEFSEQDVCPESICVALGRINRFASATNVPYTVLHHTIIGTEIAQDLGLSINEIKQYFLHDWSEGVTGIDMHSQMKNVFKEYREFESGIQKTIYRKYGLPEQEYSRVNDIDKSIVYFESGVNLVNGSKNGTWLEPAVWISDEKYVSQMRNPKPLSHYYYKFEDYCKLLLGIDIQILQGAKV